MHPYRGGYLPEERREIEKRSLQRRAQAVDQHERPGARDRRRGLDASIIVGYPGTIASTWQQAGRAGRGKEEAIAIFIPYNTPIDQYLVRHPEYFFGKSPENAIIDPGNPHILMAHLRCAAFELPLAGEGGESFGEYAPAILELLEDEREVKFVKGQAGTGWAGATRAPT